MALRQQVRDLFQELADLPPGERARILAERDVSTDIRSEVESLLSHDTDDLLLTGTIAASAEALVDSVIPDYCGTYRLTLKLGQGGMGTVYLGERSDGTLTQRAAVKLLDGHRPSWTERFRNERQLLASLQHPSIVHVLDAGVTANGRPYLAMEYVEGEPIDVYARDLPLREKLALMLRVCAGVSHAHQRLIIHRDLKPSNILVDREGQPKLLDFGLAKLLDQSGDATLTIERLLTPHYASPEQIEGRPQSTATDIYSLGAVLYRLIVGRSPHEDQAGTSRAIEIAQGRASITSAREIDPRVPKDLDAILAKALRREPDERYATVDALTNDLQAFLDGRPVAAQAGGWYRARKFLRRHWIPAVAAALVIASLTAGLVVANRSRRLAELRFSQLRVLSTRVLEFDRKLGELPGSVDARRVLVDTTLRYLRGLSESAKGDVELSREVARGYYRVGDIQGSPSEPNLGEPKKAEATFALAEEWVTRVLDARPADPAALSLGAMIASDRMEIAANEKRKEDRDRFLALVDSRIGLWSRSKEPKENPQFFWAGNMLYNSALQQVNAHRYQQAEQLLARAESSAKQVGDDFIVVMSESLRASALQFRGDLDSALQLIESIPPQPPDGVPVGNAFYSVYTHQAQILGEDRAVSLGRTADAIAVWERVFAELQKRARQDPKDALVRDRGASVARQLGAVLVGVNPARALEVYDAALRGLAALPTASTRRIERRADLLVGSANALRKLGRSVAASQRLREAVGVLEDAKILPAAKIEFDSAPFAVLEGQAIEAQTNGDRRRAQALYEDLLRLVEASKPDLRTDLRDVPRMSALYDALGLEDRRLELWQHWSHQLPGNPFVEKQLALAQAAQKKVR